MSHAGPWDPLGPRDRACLAAFAAFAALFGAGASAASPPPGVIHAFDRTIPLDKYLRLTHAESVFVDQRSRRVYLAVAEGETKRLAELILPERGSSTVDFGAARPISSIDLSKRNFWGAAWSTALGRPVILTDEAGEERTNLYAVQPDGSFERLTDVGYVYGWSVSPDGRSLAYASRESVEFSPGTLRTIDLASRAERVLFRDSKALRPYWSTPSWRADSAAFLSTVVLDEDRARQNVALVATAAEDAREPRLVTKATAPRELILPKKAWVDDRSFVYISTERGEHELLHVRLDGTVRVLALRKRSDAGQLSAASVIHVRDRPHVVAVVSGPVTDSIRVLEVASGRTVFERDLAETVTLESTEGERAILRTTSQTNPVSLLELAPDGSGFALRPVVQYLRAVDDVVQCRPEKVSYRTFDGLAAPGERGTLHAWLYRPRKALPPERGLLIVEAFYGGGKSFNSIYSVPVAQLFCAAGIHVLSPAPRGSWEMGRSFRHLIRGDLGGAEILDVVEAAKWGSRKLGIPPARVGAYGLSHGGYATMRLLTLPESVNGRRVDFRFGFGISDAGISNLVRHAGNSNIRGWSVDLMGEDPEGNPRKWLDRSPETHAHRLAAPLLLLHGTSDQRVKIVESRAMAAKLRELGKPVSYVELEGMAHGTGPLPQIHEYWRAVFHFLETEVMRP